MSVFKSIEKKKNRDFISESLYIKCLFLGYEVSREDIINWLYKCYGIKVSVDKNRLCGYYGRITTRRNCSMYISGEGDANLLTFKDYDECMESTIEFALKLIK